MGKKLNQRIVDTCKPPIDRKEIIVWDSVERGLLLRVLKSGIKTYYFKYRMRDGSKKQRQIKLGRHNELSLDEARRLANEHKTKICKGIDPLVERDDQSKGVLLSELTVLYLEYAENRKKTRTSKEYRRLLEKWVLPQFGNMKVADIDSGDITKIHNAMRDTPYQANRVLAVVSAMFSWGKRNAMWKGANPCDDVEKYNEEKRDNSLSAVELARLDKILTLAINGELKQLDKAGKETKKRLTLSPYAIEAIRLLIYTGARLNEILCLRWGNVDFQKAYLNLSDSKTGPKKIPLSSTALQILGRLDCMRVRDNDHVFVGKHSGAHIVNIQKTWGIICKRAGIFARLHDLRHTYASFAVSAARLGLPMIGAILGHNVPATTARYAHLADDSLKQASNEIDAHLLAAMNGKAESLD